MMIKLIRYALIMAILNIVGCTWVEPTKEGNEVLLVKSFNIESCVKLGTANTSVKHKVGPITRSEEKVTEELITLAKNRAAEMGGDSIVAKAPASEGSMSFEIYKCAE